MSDTTRNDGDTHRDNDVSPAPAYREPEPLDYDAPATDDAGAHAVTAEEATRSDADATSVSEERPAAVPYEDPAYDPPVTHDPPAVETTERAVEPAAVPAATAAAPADTTADTTSAFAPAVAGATAAGTATTAADALTQQYPDYSTGTAQPAPQTPIYVQAPTPPKNRGNRGSGILIALLATVAYAALFALVVSVISGITSATVAEATQTFVEFIVRPVFYVPVIFFFLGFAALVAIANRAGWWAYVLGGFLVAVVVYFSYIGGALLTVQAWNLTPSEAGRFVSTQWLNPGAVTAAILAREVPIWFGAWIARNGRKVTERNIEARKEYDRQIAEGPQIVRQ
jgi:hypothetical protein